jgi:hypothetical protein
MSEKAESGTVLAVCVSREKGTQKQNVGSAHFIEDFGIEGDAHAGKWHRQVSLLSHDKIEAFRAKGAEVIDGAFGENLVVTNLDFRSFPVGTAYMPRCDLRDDADRKRVSSRVSYFSEDGRVHYAERRCFCKSDPRRRDQNRRYYVRRESGKFQVSGHLKDEKGRE